MPALEQLKNAQNQLIRKANDGSVLVGDYSTAAPIAALTEMDTSVPPALTLAAFTGYEGVGWVNEDGAQFSREVDSSDITSWGSVEPTRRDITSDVTTLAIACQETNRRTIGLYSGADMSVVTPDATTGEVKIPKPARPSARTYRVLALAEDQIDAGPIWIGRFFPRAQVTDYDDQAMSSGDDPVMYPVTFTAYNDADLGYSECWLFGGPGWQSLLTDMGFTA